LLLFFPHPEGLKDSRDSGDTPGSNEMLLANE
jgi:hypothetical protein